MPLVKKEKTVLVNKTKKMVKIEPNVKKEIHVKIFSHIALVKWANELTSSSLYKIEELSSGVAYCKIINGIAPLFLPMNKIKLKASKPLDVIYNLELLQGALRKMKSGKVCFFLLFLFDLLQKIGFQLQAVPIQDIIRATYKHNFEFAQWFKQFYDSEVEKRAGKIKVEKDGPLTSVTWKETKVKVEKEDPKTNKMEDPPPSEIPTLISQPTVGKFEEIVLQFLIQESKRI